MNDVPPSEGLVAGKYQLLRLIGRGGMGSVWEAKHVSLGTPSAIKFIEAEYANSQEARARFDREARAAATIQSKHAIQIFDHGVTDDGKPYIVMELLQGEPLDRCIERQQLSLQDTARILQQVSRGLARAHERGIIHRDLKPENIYLVRTPDDDEAIAKVLDFGIAKMQGSPGNSGGLTSGTKTGAVLGTPFYMSPEQARGLRNVDHRTDVWSLGIIAFKCLTGRLPFDGESVGDLLVKICTAPPPVPSQIQPGINPSFDAWFMRSLEREPERRFANVTEQSDALCIAAGIAPRAQGTPYSGGAIGSGSPVVTPVNYTPVTAAAAPVTPVTPVTPAGGMPGYGQYPSGGDAGSNLAGTPMPGAMTNAPFTSESIPGLPSGRGKLVVGVIAVFAILGGAVGAVFLYMNQQGGSATHVVEAPTTASAVTNTPAAPTSSAPAEKLTPIPDPQPLPSASALLLGVVTPPSPPSPKSQGKAAKTPAAKPPVPIATTAPPPPPPLPTATATTPKKPNKNDPGY